MDVKIFDNYGVLAHEKQHVYTTAPEATAKVSEPFYIIIPSGLRPYVTVDGAIAIEPPDGLGKYLLSECLATGRNGMPVIAYVDKYGERRSYLPGTYGCSDKEDT